MKTALIFDCYDDYEIRIRFIKEAMERAGYAVHIFFSDFDHYGKKYVTKKREGIEYLHADAYEKNLSYARIHSHLVFSKTCVKKAEEYTDVSLIYVMVPPNSMCKAFAKYHAVHPDTKIMYDLCDMWPESLPLSSKIKKLGSPVFNIWRNFRNHSIGSGDCVLSECDLFAQAISPYVEATKLHTVYLCQEYHETEYLDKSDASVSFLYCGSINHLIDIPLITSLLTEVSKYKKVYLHVIGNGESKDTFISEAEHAGISVVYHGPVYEEEKKQKIYQQCQFGLNIMVDTVFVGLTMKSLDYMSHDLPLINNIQGDTWKFVENNKIGINLKERSTVETAKEIVNVCEHTYNQYRTNVKDAFESTFDEKIILKQFDKILEDI